MVFIQASVGRQRAAAKGIWSIWGLGADRVYVLGVGMKLKWAAPAMNKHVHTLVGIYVDLPTNLGTYLPINGWMDGWP